MSAAPRPRRRSLLEDMCEPMCAINWAVDHLAAGEHEAFLRDWREGDFSEWDDYRQWVQRNPPMIYT